jgi:hypothetical protein
LKVKGGPYGVGYLKYGGNPLNKIHRHAWKQAEKLEIYRLRNKTDSSATSHFRNYDYDAMRTLNAPEKCQKILVAIANDIMDSSTNFFCTEADFGLRLFTANGHFEYVYSFQCGYLNSFSNNESSGAQLNPRLSAKLLADLFRSK